MANEQRPYTLDRVVRIGIAAGLLWGLVWLLGYLSDVLIPFAVALLLAYLINPLVILIQKKIPRRVPAVFISLIIVFSVAVLLVVIIAPMIVGEIKHMGKVASDVVNNSAVAERAAKALPPDIWKAIKNLLSRQEIQDFFKTSNFIGLVQNILKKIMPGLWGIITGTTNFLLGILGLSFILLYLIFLLLDYHRVREGWKNLIPPDHRDTVVAFVTDFDRAMHRYFRGQAAVASIVGVLHAIGFSLVGLPLGILLGIAVGVFNMVPYLQLLAIPPALILAVVHAVEVGGSIWLYIGLTLLVFAVVQLIQDGFLVPRIMGDITGLSPAIILLSLSVWGKLLGMLGLLI
jgi:predicted PurR-regulated permease PerM